MERYMITHSLLSSWLYSMKENPYEDATCERDTMQEFLRVLRREPTETTAAMQDGINFEDLVTAILRNEVRISFPEINHKTKEVKTFVGHPCEHKWWDAANKVAAIVHGGLLQYRAKKVIQVDGMQIFLYGRLDCLKAGEVFDIKFSSSYDRGKYFDSTQHPTYMEIVSEATKFTYLVSNGSDVWRETYRRDEVKGIRPVISDFLAWLRAMDLLDVFKEKWRAL